MAIRCYVGKGNDYKEAECAIDDHSCVKELGSIIFSVKLIFAKIFMNLISRKNEFVPNFLNKKSIHGKFDKSVSIYISFLVPGESNFNRRCSEEKAEEKCSMLGFLKTSKSLWKCRCTTDLCNSSRRLNAGYVLSLVVIYNIFKMII